MDCRRNRLEGVEEIERKAGTEIPLPQRRLYLSASKEANSADVIKFGLSAHPILAPKDKGIHYQESCI
jgi:hypothetical protein